VAGAAALRAVAALAVSGPWLLPDEAAYALLGRGLWRHADLAVLGGPSPFASALYPALAGLPLLAGEHAGYAVLRVLQALALCSAAVAVYAWARMVARPPWALAAAVLTLALPGLAYAGELVAETLLLPLATLAGWLAVRALEAPSRRNQLALVAALACCAATRGEANALAPALLAAALATGRVRALWPTWAGVAAVAAVWLGLGGGTPLRSLGSYGFTGAFTAHRAVDLVLEHAGELLLVCGVVPACAAALLALGRPRERPARATAVYALALAAVASVEAGVFSAAHAGRLLERELLFALPPLFVAFAGWLGRGAPRPRAATLAVAAAAVAALLALPFGRLATPAAVPENPSLVPLAHLDSPRVYGVVALVALGSAAALLGVRARWRWLFPALLAPLLAATAVSATDELADRSEAARAAYAAPAAAWLDRAAPGPVTLLYDGSPDWQTVWSQLFWNDRVGRVLDVTSARVPGPLPQAELRLLGDDGALRLVGGAPAEADLVAAPQGFRFRGTRLAASRRLGLALWRLDGPPRVRTWAQGLERNGDVPQGGVATLDVFDCGRGSFHLVAVGRDEETLRLSRDGRAVARTALWPEGVWEQTVATPAAGPHARCTFTLVTSSLVHLSTFEWTPA